jgi:hypothetical protein
MYSSLIGKVQKAKQYSQERDRIRFEQLKVSFRGDNDSHEISFADGHWHCTCHFFAGWGLCSHTMAMEKILGEMLPVKQTFEEALQGERSVVGTLSTAEAR